ncbi:MAG: hypothetical protein VX435_15210, partial [Planctomycetota bacterium]|nr:hypothetical protein [Planctomycetota bacterium]
IRKNISVNRNLRVPMSNFEIQMLESLKEVITALRLLTVEAKRQSSLESRMLDRLESIDKSLDQGALAEQLRFFMSEFQPQLRETYAIRSAQLKSQNLRNDIKKARLKASAGSDSVESVSSDALATNPVG